MRAPYEDRQLRQGLVMGSNICIDARSLGYAGIRTYARCLLPMLLKTGNRNDYLLLSDKNDEDQFKDFNKEQIPTGNPLGWMIWSNSVLPRILKDRNISVYHSLKHVTAFRGTARKLITFHGARHFTHPRYSSWRDLAYWRTMSPAAAKLYDCVITVSEAEKKNYMRHMKLPERKFRVIHLAADERYHVIEDKTKLQAAKRKHKLPDQFILYVGRIVPIKNIEGMIRAYQLARKKGIIEHKLVVVGGKTPHFKRLNRLARELGIQEDIIFTGRISDDLPALYNLADLFVLPSHYEAFPAVPLEAMACGTPVICSRTGGLPEVVGDAAISVRPSDAGALSDAIIEVLSSSQLRESMIKKGMKRVGLFSWERCAREHQIVYEELGM
jgi:glycosyltransferase involved in cell wall biosynthesis